MAWGAAIVGNRNMASSGTDASLGRAELWRLQKRPSSPSVSRLLIFGTPSAHRAARTPWKLASKGPGKTDAGSVPTKQATNRLPA